MLKRTNQEIGTLFLEFFTKELILNSKPKKVEVKKEAEEKKELEVGGEKLEEKKVEEEKKEVVEEIKKETPEKIEEEYIKSPKIIPIETMPGTKITKTTEAKKRLIIPTKKIFSTKISQKQIPPAQKVQISPIQRRFAMPVSDSTEQPRLTMPISGLSEVGGGVNLGKLNMFLVDRAVTMIECSGPDKFLLVKKAGKINLTKVTLSQKEIDRIIENFSERARIPIIGGVFKARVGDLIISAILSGFVGSRFIIYKVGPYSLIEQQPLQELQMYTP